MENEQIRGLILRKLTGQASSEEIQELESWASLSTSNKHYLDQLHLVWDYAEIDDKELVNTDVVWNRLEQTIRNGRVIKKEKFAFYRFAAILILAIGVMGLMYYLFTPPSSEGQQLAQREQQETRKSSKKSTRNNTSVSVDQKKPIAKQTIKSYQTQSSDKAAKGFYFSDSSYAWLEKGSSLRFQEFDGSVKRQVFLDGEGAFQVRHQKQPFEVITDHLKVEVVGTIFAVRENMRKKRIEIYVKDGEIKVREQSNPRNVISVKAGEYYYYDTRDKSFQQKKSKLYALRFARFCRKAAALLDRK